MCWKVRFFVMILVKLLASLCVVADKPELLFVHRGVCVCECGSILAVIPGSAIAVVPVSSNSPETLHRKLTASTKLSPVICK